MQVERTETVLNTDGNMIRIELPEPDWSGTKELSTGVFLSAVWIGETRVVTCIDNCWQRHDGTIAGPQYRVECEQNYPWLAKICPDVAESLDRMNPPEQL